MTDREPRENAGGETQPQNVQSPLNRWLSSWGERFSRFRQPKQLPALPGESPVQPPIEEVVPRVTNITGILAESLKPYKAEITPPELEHYMEPAHIGVSNETVSSDFFPAVRARNPDGYVVGIGPMMIYSTLFCFPRGVLPRGIVMLEINPDVVLMGKVLINAIANSKDRFKLISDLFETSEDYARGSVKELIDAEEDEALKQRWQKVDLSKFYRELQKGVHDPEAFKHSYWADPFWDLEGGGTSIVSMVQAKYDEIKQLIAENNIALVYADFTNPRLIEAVRGLPGFQDSTNIIYLSDSMQSDINLAALPNLRAYEEGAKRPIYIDTANSLESYWRARRSLPEYDDEPVEVKVTRLIDTLLKVIEYKEKKNAGLDYDQELENLRRPRPEGLIFADEVLPEEPS